MDARGRLLALLEPKGLFFKHFQGTRDTPVDADGRPWRGKWWSGRGSNPRPLHCERSALPAELPPHTRRAILE